MKIKQAEKRTDKVSPRDISFGECCWIKGKLLMRISPMYVDVELPAFAFVSLSDGEVVILDLMSDEYKDISIIPVNAYVVYEQTPQI